MPEPSLSSPCKCRRSGPPQLYETSQPVSKKQRLSPPSGSQLPAAFWDNLSKIWLTKGALRELDRRNTQASRSPPHSLYRPARRPVTRNFIAESRNRRTAQCTAGYLRSCEPRILKDIRLFSRHGGPDLSDLRNVCVARYLPACAKADERSLVSRTYPSLRSHDEFQPAEFSEPTTGFYNYFEHQAHYEHGENKEHWGL